MDALDRAIAVFGTQEKFAEALGIKSPSVSEWRTRQTVPVDRCLDIERVTKGAVSFADLRPDLANALAASGTRKKRARTA